MTEQLGEQLVLRRQTLRMDLRIIGTQYERYTLLNEAANRVLSEIGNPLRKIVACKARFDADVS
jgi:hypothetical protein